MPYHPGDILIEKYRIEALIGGGAFGEVYRVTHLSLNVPRAIKILRRDAPGIGSSEFNDCRSRFQFEAQLGARLNTPAANQHLLQVHDFQEKGKLLLLEMEYASGGSLAERLEALKARGENMTVGDVLQMGIEVAEGLSALHKMDIVHRDLKPSNILFDRDGHAKVADLGLAQMPGGPSQRTKLGQDAPAHPGTPTYMSPEQHNSRDYLPPASDVYTLGLVLFEALTGRMYRSQRLGTRASSLRQDVPGWLDDLLVRMLAEDPKERPWNGAEAANLLQRGLEQKLPVRPGPVKPIRSPGICKRWLVWASGVLLLVLIAILMVVLGNRGTKRPSTTAVSTTAPTNITTSTSTLTSMPTLENSTIPTDNPIPLPIPTPIPGLNIGSTWIRPADEMVMVYVPEGNFMMGSPDGTGAADEHPQHTVFLNSYWIDKTEVTNARYSLCVQAGDCQPPIITKSPTHPSYYGSLQYEDYPVIYVDWVQADAYCHWVGARLPTEAEWEKAARETTGRIFPWGNSSPTCLLANYLGCVGDTTKAGTYPSGASLYQALDMAGNVWEWVLDWYDAGYYNNRSPNNNASGPDSGVYRVLRGGSWDNTGDYIRSAVRYRYDPGKALSSIGFRCALSAP